MKIRPLLVLLLSVAAAAAGGTLWFTRAPAPPDCGIEAAEERFEATQELLDCAAAGHPQAQAWLGGMYWSAANSPDPREPVSGEPLSAAEAQEAGWRWMRSAAGNGSASAKNDIGYIYLEGMAGANADPAEAKRWFEDAYAAGDDNAPLNLARIYASGAGVEADFDTAFDYLKISARQGNDVARCALSMWKNRAAGTSDDTDIQAFSTLLEGSPRCPPKRPGDGFRRAKAAFDETSQAIRASLSGRIDLLTATPSGAEECAVVRAVLSDLTTDAPLNLRPTTRITMFGGHYAPQVFGHDTGETETVTYGGITYDAPVTEPVEYDAGPLLDDLTSGDTLRIDNCFEDSSAQPRFWVGSYQALRARSGMHRQDPPDWPTLWSISMPGFSADGMHALIYAEYNCGGGLCAEGGYYLMEKSAGGWAVLGYAQAWIS